MDEQELKIIRLQCQIVALEFVVGAILSSLTQTLDARESVLALLDQMPEKSGQAAFPDAGPEFSDLYAAELRDAFDGLASFLKNHLSYR
jgi:hypothetical protein